MKTLVSERKLDIEALPEPVAAEYEVDLDVDVGGICGSDLRPYRGHAGLRVLGHEAAGHTGDDDLSSTRSRAAGSARAA